MTTEAQPVVPEPVPDLAHAIAKAMGGDMTPEKAAEMLNALNHVRDGDPVGMVRRNDEDGAVAHRVDNQGLDIWRVTLPNGDQWNDMQPTLEWPVIYEPGAK